MVNPDPHVRTPSRGANIVDQPRMDFEPRFVGEIMPEIALEQNDAGGLQFSQKRAVLRVENRQGLEPDKKMMANGSNGVTAHAASPRP